MRKQSKFEFFSLLTFLVVATLLLSNGFVARIFAQDKEPDVFRAIEPTGVVLDAILREYVLEPDLDRLVEGALVGMMSSLDRHSSFISKDDLDAMREDTKGEFEGIGVSIKLDDDDNIMVFMPITDSPAAKEGIRPFDIITEIDGVSALGMTLSEAADRIRGKRGTYVELTIRRALEGVDEPEILKISVKRDKVPLESIKEARLLEDGIGYVRISDFKDTTARDLKKKLKEYLKQGMTAFVLDLRWNPGGLLSASKEVCELFLPKNSLVTYTKARANVDGEPSKDDMELHTEGRPVLPLEFSVIVLVNDQTASSSEIVTGALQYHKRALVVGEKTFGKGSVQTIIPLTRPEGTALRLTTALYYTPADVTIDHQGILPDIEVAMSLEQERALGMQMYKSYQYDPVKRNEQNHGTATGNTQEEDLPEETPEQHALLNKVLEVFGPDTGKALEAHLQRKREAAKLVEDLQLLRAVDILREDTVWENLLRKYHRDVHETQVAANAETLESLAETERQLLESPGTEKLPVEVLPDEEQQQESPEGEREDSEQDDTQDDAPVNVEEPAPAP